MYDSTVNLRRAISLTDELCLLNHFKIIEMETKEQGQGYVLKIDVGGVICQLELGIEIDEN